MVNWSGALFQPEGTGDYPQRHAIADREPVYESLGLYSDYLNWNTQPETEQRLRSVLCEIYGHWLYDGSPFTWKPKDLCYWCFARVPEYQMRDSFRFRTA